MLSATAARGDRVLSATAARGDRMLSGAVSVLVLRQIQPLAAGLLRPLPIPSLATSLCRPCDGPHNGQAGKRRDVAHRGHPYAAVGISPLHPDDGCRSGGARPLARHQTGPIPAWPGRPCRWDLPPISVTATSDPPTARRLGPDRHCHRF
jgi:hypothetical protein